MRRHIRLFAVAAGIVSMSFISARGEIPAGYYDKCEGKTGESLLTALCSTISDHTTVSYKGLWSLYASTDVDENGKIWDMYSTKRWTYAKEQCGNYSRIGDCYNREHSFPKSWFSDASPMYSDAFHIYPTDGKVNGQRSNYPFGECANGTYVASNGSVKALGRLGKSTFSGYSGTVFEPDDMYKGDFARSYFYMAACYNDRIAGWSSDMLANNSYPCFTTWAKNLLMKWTRQDEVSQKERDRQEAVYARQKNRNPFIDHPELAEYIWGDKVGQPWHSNSAAEQPDILRPVQNTTLDLGIAAIGQTRTLSVPVKTRGVTGSVVISVYGVGYSVTPERLTATQANAGTEVTVSYTGETAGTHYGTFAVTADEMELELDMQVKVLDGIPVNDATGVTSDEFTVSWLSIGDADTYTLHVMLNGEPVAGYPRQVDAAAQSHIVTGLEPNTTYTFRLTSATMESETKTVTTADVIPSIDLMFDGTLAFTSEPGVPSGVAELLLVTENISDDIVITVSRPFEVSTDKSTWGTTVTLDPEEDRFYMRANSAAAGTFTTTITVTAGTYFNDDAEASATIAEASSATVIEDWEGVENPTTDVKCYSNKSFRGTAFLWIVANGGFGTDTNDKNFNGTTVMRMGKNSDSALTMGEDKQGGIGSVTFDAAKWGNDGDAVIELEYSSDQGDTWESVKQFTLTSNTPDTFSADVNKSGAGRIRFRQTAGARWHIDNISLGSYSDLGAVDDLEYHSWDAFCRNGLLVIECRDKAEKVTVYSVDGMTLINEILPSGSNEFSVAKGLYLVVVDDFVRRVLVK